jgi:hypothetical protein
LELARNPQGRESRKTFIFKRQTNGTKEGKMRKLKTELYIKYAMEKYYDINKGKNQHKKRHVENKCNQKLIKEGKI